MPIVDGYELTRTIRTWETTNKHRRIPIVCMSAHTLREGWAQASEAGFTHYCGKPISFMDLGNILLEITTPGAPHVFLRDRPLPRVLRSEDDGGSESEDSSGEEEEEK